MDVTTAVNNLPVSLDTVKSASIVEAGAFVCLQCGLKLNLSV